MTTTPPRGQGDALRARARDAIARQPYKTHTVLSGLLASQDALGYLPPEAIDEVAKERATTTNDVWGVASFYPNFRFTPPGRHTVEVCWGPTCHVLGAQPILQGLLQSLGLKTEGDTPDGAVTLKMNTCLGVCAHGPAMSFDHALAGHMTPQKALVGLQRVRQSEAAGQTGRENGHQRHGDRA